MSTRSTRSMIGCEPCMKTRGDCKPVVYRNPAMLSYWRLPPHHPRQARMGETLADHYLKVKGAADLYLYVNDYLWLERLQFFIGRSQEEGPRLWAYAPVYDLAPVLFDLGRRAGLSPKLYPKQRRRPAGEEALDGAGIDLWGGSEKRVLRRLSFFDPCDYQQAILIEVATRPSAGETQRLYVAVERHHMRSMALRLLGAIRSWEAEGRPSYDDLKRFVEGRARGRRLEPGAFPEGDHPLPQPGELAKYLE